MATGGPHLNEETSISFYVDKGIIQNPDFQKFIWNLKGSQRVNIDMDEFLSVITITGKKTAIEFSKSQIQMRVTKLTKPPTMDSGKPFQPPGSSASNKRNTVELAVARINFLELFGQEILDRIRGITGVNSADITNGQLQLSANVGMIETIRAYLEEELHQESIQITVDMKKHFESTNHGRLLQEFLQKYRVGSSLQGSKHGDKHNFLHRRGNSAGGRPGSGNIARGPRSRGYSNHDQRGRGRGNYDQPGRGRGSYDQPGRGRDNYDQPGRGRGSYDQSGRGRGSYDQPGRGSLPVHDPSPNLVGDLTNLNENIFENYGEGGNDVDEGEDAKVNDDNKDDNNGGTSDSDSSSVSTRTKDFEQNTEQLITITLCSDSKDSLSKAVEELRNYSFCSKQWALTVEQTNFILKQEQRGKPEQTNHSISEPSRQIKTYLVRFVHDYSVHVYIFYYRGIWHVRVNGSKQRVQSAISKMQSYLNDVVETEVQLPISETMAIFLGTKASSDIRKLETKHNIKIIIFPPHRKHNADNNNGQNNVNKCLKLLGSTSRIKSAQGEVENFLDNLLEHEQNFPCDNWDLAHKISTRFIPCFKKISGSNDYEAIGRVKFYNSAIERRETTPKITFTIVCLDKETMDDVVQQCTDIIDGYLLWKPSADEYRAIDRVLRVNESPSLETFQKEWDIQIQLDRNTNTITIPARSKMIAEEIKEALQNLGKGQGGSDRKITEIIPIPRNIRSFVIQSMHSIFNEARVQKVNIDSRNRNELKLYGFRESIIPMKEKIITIVNDIQRKIIQHRLILSSAESELMRENSYKIVLGIESETKTIIRDVKVDADRSEGNENNEDKSASITSVANNRGQTILVKKGDITKVRDVDAIINAANGALQHSGGVAKMIKHAAGPTLDEECQKLIAQNRGVAISTGTAVKTTAGNLPLKSIIHAIGPQYQDGNKQERPLLFRCVLASLQLAEKEGYKSIALPAISSVTYGFPLQDCTTIVIRAVKQFFADFPQSNVRKVILLDIDDSACNSFAREVINDHTTTVDNDIVNYDLPPPLTSIWRWQDYSDEMIYDENHTRQIEDAFQQYLQTSIPSTLKLAVDVWNSGEIIQYSIHFQSDLKQRLAINPNLLNTRIECGYQLRVDTGTKRYIFRYPLAQQQRVAPATVYRPKPIDTYQLQVITLDIEWDIISMTREAVQQAEDKMRKAIESSKMSELFSVSLKNDIETHENAIRRIAQQQSVQVDFQKDSGGRFSMTLIGFKQNIMQAKLDISQYAQDILQIEGDKDDQLNTPKEWGEQQELCKLVDLPRNHPDFIRIEVRMKETMSNVRIEQIQRVQNTRLWNYYALKRQHVQQKLNDKSNIEIEMELFHGTRNTPPSEIYDGEHGFDMTFSSQGLWGTGTYFAHSASYSCSSYSYSTSNGKRQVFLAQVLTGKVYDFQKQTDQNLRRPPKIEGRVPTTYYDSVSGETGSSQVYIVYYSDLAYPTYLITFTV